jgi:hypothetical protein
VDCCPLDTQLPQDVSYLMTIPCRPLFSLRTLPGAGSLMHFPSRCFCPYSLSLHAFLVSSSTTLSLAMRWRRSFTPLLNSDISDASPYIYLCVSQSLRPGAVLPKLRTHKICPLSKTLLCKTISIQIIQTHACIPQVWPH